MAIKDRIQAMPQMLAATETGISVASADISDETAVKTPLFFPDFMETLGSTFKQGQIIRHEGELYRIGQPQITTSTVYVPGTTGTESIYSHIEISEEGYEVWKEWDGISGIYKQDQIVQDPFDDYKLYISKIPNNVWGPPHEQPTYWAPYDGS